MYNPHMDNELKGRWMRLQQALQRAGGDALLVTSNVNLYYLSGRIFSGMALLLPEGAPLFFVRRPVELHGDTVIYIRKPEEMLTALAERGIALPTHPLLELDAISYTEYQRYAKLFATGTPIGNGSPVLREVRTFKSVYEVGMLLRSGALHTEVYQKIPALFTPGMTDLDLSIEIERELRRHGSLGIFRIFGQSMEIFMGSLLAGDNADTPSPYDFAMGGGGLNASLPVGSNGTPLQEGMSVMVDMGGNFTGYMTDMTRVFSVGQLPDLALKAHDTALTIQERVQQMAAPGAPVADLYRVALEIAQQAELAPYFMGHRQQAGFVGHGIGLEINEAPVLAPRSKEQLAAGMVFALEPKFVLPGVGAVGVENSFLVTDTGVEKLTLCEEKILPLGKA
ncbi:MAG: Xaa-Pro peptidase family protein [Alistipes sp.]|nr:Xaa-Pro peptidase family protein [Alistipes sp.]